jgi:hypothetical protein
MVGHQYQDGGCAVVSLTSSSRLVISVYFLVYSALHSFTTLYYCFVCYKLHIYYSWTPMIDLIHCIPHILSILLLHLFSENRKEMNKRKSLVNIQIQKIVFI